MENELKITNTEESNSENKTSYDPTKNYKWEKESEFIFKGEDFAFLHHSLIRERNQILHNLELLEKKIEIVRNALIHAVEKGVAIESNEEVNDSEKEQV